MDPSTNEPVTTTATATATDLDPATVVRRRTTAGPDRLPVPDRPEETGSASINQSGADQQQSQHSAGPSSTTGSFECNICLDTAHDAVVSMCGHLFCWPCLHRWMETPRAQQVCPVCKAAISMDKVIPLYGRGGDHTRDPRSKVPPRPAGHRVEPDPGAGNGGSVNPGLAGVLGGLFGNMDLVGGNNFRMSVGIGAFPLGFLATAFNVGGAGSEAGGAGGGAGTGANDRVGAVSLNADNDFISKLCLFVAIFCLVWLLLA